MTPPPHHHHHIELRSRKFSQATQQVSSGDLLCDHIPWFVDIQLWGTCSMSTQELPLPVLSAWPFCEQRLDPALPGLLEGNLVYFEHFPCHCGSHYCHLHP